MVNRESGTNVEVWGCGCAAERRASDGLVPVADGDTTRQPDGQCGQRRRRHALETPLRR